MTYANMIRLLSYKKNEVSKPKINYDKMLFSDSHNISNKIVKKNTIYLKVFCFCSGIDLH